MFSHLHWPSVMHLSPGEKDDQLREEQRRDEGAY